MKNIAVIVPGGISTPKDEVTIPSLHNLIIRLSHHFDITVYSLSRVPNQESSFEIGNIKVRSLPTKHKDSFLKKLFYLILNLWKDHRSQPFDFIHGVWAFPAGFFAVLLGKTLGLPSVVSLQGGEAANLPEIRYGNMHHWLLRDLTLWSCHNADELTCLTRFQWDKITVLGLRRKNVRVIPNGADRSVFSVQPKTLSPPFHFIHVANLTEVKDQKMLLKAFFLIQRQVECRLRIIGPDHLKGQLHKFSKELKIDHLVEFWGKIPNKELPKHYHWAHIMLHTSLYEGAGMVISEAAASGVVICGTKVGLISDLGDNCTISVDVGDYQSLAKKTLELLKDKPLYERLQTNAYRWAETHDADWTAQQFINTYDQL